MSLRSSAAVRKSARDYPLGGAVSELPRPFAAEEEKRTQLQGELRDATEHDLVTLRLFLESLAGGEEHTGLGGKIEEALKILDRAIQRLRSMAGVLPPQYAEFPLSVRGLDSGDAYGLSVLTPREREVVKLVAKGKSVRAIAAMLGRSVKTVEAHKFNLMRKLHIHNKAQLVAYAIQNGIVELSVGA